MKILKQYISRWVLPNEKILSYVKWNDSIDFDQIIIQSEADIKFNQILNIDKSVHKQKNIDSGIITIDHNMLYKAGFMGFISTYTVIPESEREIGFKIIFMKNKRCLKTITLKTYIIRPIIEIKPKSKINILESSPMHPILFKLSNKGKANAVDLKPFIKFIDSDSMNIKIESDKKHVQLESNKSIDIPFESTKPGFNFKVDGSGQAMFIMGFNFKDAQCNEYVTKPIIIPITKSVKKSVKIPINSTINGQSSLILTSETV